MHVDHAATLHYEKLSCEQVHGVQKVAGSWYEDVDIRLNVIPRETWYASADLVWLCIVASVCSSMSRENPPLTERPALVVSIRRKWCIKQSSKDSVRRVNASRDAALKMDSRSSDRNGVFSDTVANVQNDVHTKSLQLAVPRDHEAFVVAELSCLSDAKDDVIAEY